MHSNFFTYFGNEQIFILSKSNHRTLLIPFLLFGIFLCLICFTSALQAQVRINVTVHYDEDPNQPIAKVKVFKDNKLYDELSTNKKRKFKMMLQLGHDFLFEVSKDYHFTTRFIVSTKLPEKKMQEDVYASFDIETDLIKNFLGLDGSIMDKPIMILRYIPEEDAFDFDRTHLKAVQSRVDRLLHESEKLERKRAKAVVKPIPLNARKVKPKRQEDVPPLDKKVEELSRNTEDESEVVQQTAEDSVPEKTNQSVDNETYEMQMRRERLKREKQKRANLALKRGYESSLIRQVAEENRKLSKAEIQQMTKEKEDSSLIEKAAVEKEIKAFKNQQREVQAARQSQATENKQTKAQMETGLIREVAASDRIVRSSNARQDQSEGSDEKDSFQIKPKIMENASKDNFKELEELFLYYPSYTLQFAKETYDFGMVNYYIDNQAVEKAEFCKELSAFKAYKIKLKCE